MTGMPNHHPSADTLGALAVGGLRAGFDVVAAAHVKTCARCRLELARLEQAEGQELAALAGATLSAGALDRALAAIAAAPPTAEAPAPTIDDLIRRARRRWVGPGIWVAPLDTPHAREDRVYVLSVAPRASTAKHTHGGAEFTQILSGALIDGDVVLRAGDFSERGPDDLHQPRVMGEAPCVCLFATQGRLRATGAIGALAFSLADV